MSAREKFSDRESKSKIGINDRKPGTVFSKRFPKVRCDLGRAAIWRKDDLELPYPAANLPEAAIRVIRVSDHRKCKKFEHRSGAQRRLSLNLRRGTGWECVNPAASPAADQL